MYENDEDSNDKLFKEHNLSVSTQQQSSIIMKELLILVGEKAYAQKEQLKIETKTGDSRLITMSLIEL